VCALVSLALSPRPNSFTHSPCGRAHFFPVQHYRSSSQQPRAFHQLIIRENKNIWPMCVLYSGEGMAGSEGGVASFSLGVCIYLHSVLEAGWLRPILTYCVAPKGNNFTECLSDENVRSCQNFQRRGSTLLKGEGNKLSLDGGCWQDALPLNRKYANFGKWL
jgi:hypothetical protein